MRYARLLAFGLLAVFASSIAPAAAQYPPQVATVPAANPGGLASGVRVLCISNPNTAASGPTCPILQLNGFTYWALSYDDNRIDMAIVAYHPSGTVAKQWGIEGARFIWKINVNAANETVEFVGQGEKTIVMTWRELAVPTHEGALSIANVKASAVNCLFAADCAAVAVDSISTFALPPNVSGSGQILTRTFTAAVGSALAGKTAYQYRVDMSQTASADDAPCVTDLAVDLGPIVQMRYDGTGAINDIYVIRQGGTGAIGVLEAVKTGNVTKFTFERPICAGRAAGDGLSSLLFGIASDHAPKAVTAIVGWPGTIGIDVAARGPAY